MDKQNMTVHQIKIDFHVTEQIKRFVYVYIIEAQHCYMIDSGVYGCEKQIIEYLKGCFCYQLLEDFKHYCWNC